MLRKKLEIAKKMLNNTDYSLREIVNKVGLPSKNNFYNRTTSQIRNYHRNSSFLSSDETNSM